MRKSLKYTITALAIASTAAYSYYSYKSKEIITGNTESRVTQTKAGPSYIYPNPNLTPGDILTTDSRAVCKSGYAKSVRNVTSAEKKQVYSEYGVKYPEPQGSYEVDHFISLELGGSNNIKNLWPEPALPIPGFHEKDKVENYLHSQVCSGEITLIEAQREIVGDWYGVYVKIK